MNDCLCLMDFIPASVIFLWNMSLHTSQLKIPLDIHYIQGGKLPFAYSGCCRDGNTLKAVKKKPFMRIISQKASVSSSL